MTSPGLLNFGHFNQLRWYWYELPIFGLMGVFGGFLGAAFVYVNKKITIFRLKGLVRHFIDTWVVFLLQPFRAYEMTSNQGGLSYRQNVNK